MYSPRKQRLHPVKKTLAHHILTRQSFCIIFPSKVDFPHPLPPVIIIVKGRLKIDGNIVGVLFRDVPTDSFISNVSYLEALTIYTVQIMASHGCVAWIHQITLYWDL
jgi:hypothetical protein